MNNITSLPQVYAVFARDAADYYAQPELMRLFANESDADAFAEMLRGSVAEPDYDGAEPELEFDSVFVKPMAVN